MAYGSDPVCGAVQPSLWVSEPTPHALWGMHQPQHSPPPTLAARSVQLGPGTVCAAPCTRGQSRVCAAYYGACPRASQNAVSRASLDLAMLEEVHRVSQECAACSLWSGLTPYTMCSTGSNPCATCSLSPGAGPAYTTCGRQVRHSATHPARGTGGQP